jgi:hypothetical protein
VAVETKPGELGLNQIRDGATVLGLVIALGVLVGLPLVAVVGGWLLAGRQPQVIARQPLE